jgi:hypothetical protein
LNANVLLAPRARMPHGPLLQTPLALIDFRAQDDFRTNGPAQFAAVRACLRPDTDLIVARRLYVGSTVLGAHVDDVPVVMDLDDIEHRNRVGQLVRSVRGGSLPRFDRGNEAARTRPPAAISARVGSSATPRAPHHRPEAAGLRRLAASRGCGDPSLTVRRRSQQRSVRHSPRRLMGLQPLFEHHQHPHQLAVVGRMIGQQVGAQLIDEVDAHDAALLQ